MLELSLGCAGTAGQLWKGFQLEDVCPQEGVNFSLVFSSRNLLPHRQPAHLLACSGFCNLVWFGFTAPPSLCSRGKVPSHRKGLIACQYF